MSPANDKNFPVVSKKLKVFGPLSYKNMIDEREMGRERVAEGIM